MTSLFFIIFVRYKRIHVLIKIIPILLWLVYKAYKASKKTQQSSNSIPKSTKRKKTIPSPPSVKEILRELTNTKKEESPVFSETYGEQEEDMDRSTSNESDTRLEEVVLSEPPQPEDIAETNELSSQEEEKVGTSTRERFDLRSAIIAETILNRPNH